MIRKATALLGELALLAGFVLVSYLVYQSWFSNYPAQQRAEQLSVLVLEQYAQEAPLEFSDRVPIAGESYSALGLLYIPALGEDVWAEPILDDVSPRALSSGVGHYPSTSLPGEEGNLGIAGHRATNGEPFARFERLRAGDAVYVQTQDGYFKYVLLEDRKIQDSEVWVLDSKPAEIDTQAKSLITLTTCDPRWNSYQRWAFWGELVDFSKEKPEELQR